MDEEVFEDLTNNERIKDFIDKLHQEYLKRIKYYEMTGKELTRFAWASNRSVSLYCIKVFSDSIDRGYCFTFFAIPNQISNKIYYADQVSKTNNYTFGSINEADVAKRISWMVSKNILSSNFVKKILASSLNFSFSNLKDEHSQNSVAKRWAKTWVDNEYHNTSKNLQKKNIIESFPLSNQQYFVDRYHFDKMLKTLNDAQFTDEFNQCLFAYGQKKWFICATGLGSCLEHLMEKIIINYNKKGYKTLRGLGKDPTFKDYLVIFRKPPINMEPRQETYIKMLSMARNSVDHHNTGYTKKNICDSLLDGIRNIFNDYYSSSILIKDAPKGKK